MPLREIRCPSCGAPLPRVDRCSYCHAHFEVTGEAGVAVTIDALGPDPILIIKCVRGFSGLGLAELKLALDQLPATFSIRDPKTVPHDVLADLMKLGARARLVRDELSLPLDPAFAGHEGAWGLRIERAGDRKIEAVKLLREFCDLGLEETMAYLSSPRVLIPIASRASHDEIRRRFSAIGYVVSFAPSGG